MRKRISDNAPILRPPCREVCSAQPFDTLRDALRESQQMQPRATGCRRPRTGGYIMVLACSVFVPHVLSVARRLIAARLVSLATLTPTAIGGYDIVSVLGDAP